MSTGRIVAIYTAANKGLPMTECRHVEILDGKGIVGDRYTEGLGAWSKNREVRRHITLIESEAIVAAQTEFGIKFTAADTRRNIVTEGVDLNRLLGKHFLLGEIVVLGVELCDPCARPGKLSGREDLRRNLEKSLENRGGLRVAVLDSGTLQPGDPIEWGGDYARQINFRSIW